jgi:hypothetical protein
MAENVACFGQRMKQESNIYMLRRILIRILSITVYRLIQAVRKHGEGKWVIILNDPCYAPHVSLLHS